MGKLSGGWEQSDTIKTHGSSCRREPTGREAVRGEPGRNGFAHWAGICTGPSGTGAEPPWNGGQGGSRTPLVGNQWNLN